MTVKATITRLDGGQVVVVDVPLMRYATQKERWTAAPKLSFDFEYK